MPLDLLFVMALAIVAAGIGLLILDRWGLAPTHPADAWALGSALGLGIISLGTLGLAEVGWLASGPIGLGLASLAIVGGRRGVVGTLAALPRSLGLDGPGRVIGGGVALTLVGVLFAALAPVTDGDALCYHLQVPKVFLNQHAAGFEPDLHETVYPLVVEMLDALALASRGPGATRLIAVVLGIVFAASVAGLARPILGDHRAGWAAAIALLTPAVANGMTAPLNDVPLAAFGAASLLAWLGWLDRPSRRGLVLAGGMAGLAIGVKYPGLVWAGLLGLATVLVGGGSVRQRVKRGVGFGLMVALVGGGWYLRAFVHTGNPVFPFFRHVFGGSGLDAVLDPSRRVMTPSAANLLTALGPMTLDPGRFDSFSHQFGPCFLLFVPALLVLRPPRRLVGIVALGYAFLVLCVSQRQSMRFVLTAVGPLAVGSAWVVATSWDRPGRSGRVLLGVLLAALGFEVSLAVARARQGLAFVAGRESADAFLARREPTVVVGRWVDAHLPLDARLIGQDHRGFYIPRPYTMELAHARRTGLARRGESAEAIVGQLRAEGFTHLLLCPPEPLDAVEFDPTLGRALGPWLAHVAPIFRRDLADADGTVRRYAIYPLAEGLVASEVARR